MAIDFTIFAGVPLPEASFGRPIVARLVDYAFIYLYQVQNATLTPFGTVVYELGTAVPFTMTPAARCRVALSLPTL